MSWFSIQFFWIRQIKIYDIIALSQIIYKYIIVINLLYLIKNKLIYRLKAFIDYLIEYFLNKITFVAMYVYL